jgi:hypothetical protein
MYNIKKLKIIKNNADNIFKNNVFKFIMSINRSVAAAQRRRATPTNTHIPPPQYTTTSIASAGNFNNQPQMSGRMAGQYADVQQKQYLQGNVDLQQQHPTSVNVNKMSIPQAITLITLRIGRLETHMQDLEFQTLGNEEKTNNNDSNDIKIQYDENTLGDFNQRLKGLELSFKDFPDFKKQLDVYKPGIVSIKNASTNNSKEITLLKQQIIIMQSQIDIINSQLDKIQNSHNTNNEY